MNSYLEPSTQDLKRRFSGVLRILRINQATVFFGLLVIHQTAISVVRFSRVAKISDSTPSDSPEAWNRDDVKFKPVYNAATAIFLTECLKALICWAILTIKVSALSLNIEEGERSRRPILLRYAPRCIIQTIVLAIGPKQFPHVINMAVPGLLYTVQNNLLYVALSNLDTPTFLVTSQLKILSTALFSVLIFKKSLTILQWTSLLLLTLGVSLVQLQPNLSTKSSHHDLNDGQDWLKGLIAIICSCFSSGLAGCYFEKLVKDRETKPITDMKKTKDLNPNPPIASSENLELKRAQIPESLSNALWAKNLQLSVCTIPFAFLAIYLDPHAYIEVTTRGFFSGYSTLVWSVIVYHAIGGILVSIIVKQSSTVTKSFANSLSIVFSALLSSSFSGVIPGRHYLLGTALVIVSTRMYSSIPSSKPKPMDVSHKKDN